MCINFEVRTSEKMSASYDYEKELDRKISKFIGNNEFLWNKEKMDYHNQGKRSAVLQLIYNKTRTQEVDDHVMARITYWQHRWQNFGKNRCELMKGDQHGLSRKRDTNGINQQRTSTMAATSVGFFLCWFLSIYSFRFSLNLFKTIVRVNIKSI